VKENPSNNYKSRDCIRLPMRLTLEPITACNYHECIALEAFPEQKDCFYFKSNKPNVVSLAEAYVYKGSRVLAIYDSKTMVGALFYNPPKRGKAWLTRLMIDRRYQRRGYGRKAMEMLVELVRKEARGKSVRLGLSYEPHNKVAEKLYHSLGFRPSGESVGEGQIVVWADIEV